MEPKTLLHGYQADDLRIIYSMCPDSLLRETIQKF